MATLTVTVARARNLPHSFLHTPSAFVEVHTLPGGQPAAESDPIPINANPEWNFTHVYTVDHHAPFVLALVVYDSTRRKAPIGRAIIQARHSVTSGWYPLSGDPNSTSEILVTVLCRNVCAGRNSSFRRDNFEKSIFKVEQNRDSERRAVSPLCGVLFRSGDLLAHIDASGVPVTLRKPHVKLFFHDQVLEAEETVSSAEEWERILESERPDPNEVNGDEQDKGNDGTGGELKNSNSQLNQEGEHCINEAQSSIDERKKSLVLNMMSVTTKNAQRLQSGTKAGLGRLRSFRKKKSQLSSLGGNDGSISLQPDGSMADSNLDYQNAESALHYLSAHEIGSTNQDRTDRLIDGDQLGATKSGKPSTTTFGKASKSNSQTSLLHKSRDSLAAISLSGQPKRRRNVNFGTVKFALFEGLTPEKLTVQLLDRASHLPAPISMLTEQTIDLREIQMCNWSCEENSNSHILEYQLSDGSQKKNRVTLTITVRVHVWQPKAFTKNVTRHFQRLLSSMDSLAQNFKDSFPQAEELTYLLIGGLFTDHYPTYFDQNIKYLQERLRLPRVQSIPIHTEGSVQRNAKVIRDSILKTCRGAKSIVLIGHSKGGVDATSVLRSYPETIPFLHGIITFQAPFGGTFLIDFVGKSKMAMNAIGGIIESVWKGDQQALQDMCYSSRLKNFGFEDITSEDILHDNRDHESVGDPDKSAQLQSASLMTKVQMRSTEKLNVYQQVPIISFGSFASFDLLSIRSAAKAAGIASMAPAAKKVLEHTGFLCDGLVTAQDARIPFSDFVSLSDMMHTEPALYVHGTHYPPGRLTATALVLLFEMVKRRTKQGEFDEQKR